MYQSINQSLLYYFCFNKTTAKNNKLTVYIINIDDSIQLILIDINHSNDKHYEGL